MKNEIAKIYSPAKDFLIYDDVELKKQSLIDPIRQIKYFTDNRNDRMDTSLYVVNGEEELGNHISRIITMEALKR